MKDWDRVSAYICMTKDIGMGGNLFGGVMLAWMDEAAAIFAFQSTGMRMVTLKYSEIVFRRPVRVGDLVEFYAGNPRTGRTSFTFDLEGRVRNEVVFHTTGIFVAVDEQGRPIPITTGSSESV